MPRTRICWSERSPPWIVIDEIQRVPALLDAVQAIVDQPSCRFRFVMTGSGARQLRRKGVNLLPGRVIRETLTPLSYLEIPGQFQLDRALQLGMLPGVYLERQEATDLLESYTDTYLREEIQAEALTRSIGNYARFLDVMAASSGQWLNYSKLSNDAEIPKETIRRYVSILEDTLIAHRIPAFRPGKKVSRRVSQRDRIILFDIGVRNALVGLHRTAPPLDQRGFLFEQWFILQVISLARSLKKPWRLSSYRTEAGAEVDLVIEGPDHVIGIEIKYGRNVNRSALRGLHSLAEVLPGGVPYRRWIVFRGERPQKFAGGYEVKPYRQALEELFELS
jgi:predicted AAA+ superfamily ATPase